MQLWYFPDMEEPGWKVRLLKAIDALNERDDISDRAISLTAKLGPNYVEHLRKKSQPPRIDGLEKLCDFLGLSIIYVLTGLELDKEGEELIRLASAPANAHRRRHVLALLKGEPGA